MVSTVMHRRAYYPDLSYMGKLKQKQYRSQFGPAQYCEAQRINYLNDPNAQRVSSFPTNSPKPFKMNQYKLKWILWNNHGRMKRSIPSSSEWNEWKWVAFNELCGSKYYKNQKADLSNQLLSRDEVIYSDQNKNVLEKFQYPPAPENVFNTYPSPDKEISTTAQRQNIFKPPPLPPLRHKDSKAFDSSKRKRSDPGIIENSKTTKKRGRKPKSQASALVSVDSDKDEDSEKLVINFDNSDIEDLLNTIENSGENLSNLVNNTSISIQNNTTTLKDLSSLIKANHLLAESAPVDVCLGNGSSSHTAPSSCPPDKHEPTPTTKPTFIHHLPGGVRSACQAATGNTGPLSSRVLVRRKSKENETIQDKVNSTTSESDGEISVVQREKENLSNNNSTTRSDLIQNQKTEQAKSMAKTNASNEPNQCKENQKTSTSVTSRWDKWDSSKSEKVEAGEKPSSKVNNSKIEKAENNSEDKAVKIDKENPKVGKIKFLPCSNCKNVTILYPCVCKHEAYCGQVCQRKHWEAVHHESEYH